MHGVVIDGIYYKHEKEKDRLRIGGGSWSINRAEILGKDVDTFVFTSEVAKYIITHKDAVKHGFIRTLGGEDKLVVPVRYWEEKVNVQKEAN